VYDDVLIINIMCGVYLAGFYFIFIIMACAFQCGAYVAGLIFCVVPLWRADYIRII